MQVIRSKQQMQRESQRLRAAGETLALVPTMGALHQGHLSLVEQVRGSCDVVAASIFVNPLQFGPSEDRQRYPRDLDGDLQKLQAAGVHCVFAPSVEDMLGESQRTHVEVSELGDGLCGARRPGHFRGVATIVSKLFHIMQPDVAIFGLKDAQQAILLRRMVLDLDFGVRLQFAPIVRDPDGLALSSRNAYLTLAERQDALLLQRGLAAGRELLGTGERRTARLLRAVHEVLDSGSLLETDYVECVDTEHLQPLESVVGRVLLAVSAKVGSTHLIDNSIMQVDAKRIEEVDLEGALIHRSAGSS